MRTVKTIAEMLGLDVATTMVELRERGLQIYSEGTHVSDLAWEGVKEYFLKPGRSIQPPDADQLRRNRQFGTASAALAPIMRRTAAAPPPKGGTAEPHLGPQNARHFVVLNDFPLAPLVEAFGRNAVDIAVLNDLTSGGTALVYERLPGAAQRIKVYGVKTIAEATQHSSSFRPQLTSQSTAELHECAPSMPSSSRIPDDRPQAARRLERPRRR